jgi:hypothetical protein
MKIRPVRAVLYVDELIDRQTDRHDETNFAFRGLTNAPESTLQPGSFRNNYSAEI